MDGALRQRQTDKTVSVLARAPGNGGWRQWPRCGYQELRPWSPWPARAFRTVSHARSIPRPRRRGPSPTGPTSTRCSPPTAAAAASRTPSSCSTGCPAATSSPGRRSSPPTPTSATSPPRASSSTTCPCATSPPGTRWSPSTSARGGPRLRTRSSARRPPRTPCPTAPS